jgi:hypothetical protein
VNDAKFVSFGQTFGDLNGDGNRLGHRQNVGAQKFSESFSFDQLQDKEVRTGIVADVVKGANVGMGKFGDGARFLLHTLAEIELLRKVLRKDFDGDVPAETGVSGTVDFPHPSGAEGGKNFVGAQLCAWRERHTLGNYNLCRRREGKFGFHGVHPHNFHMPKILVVDPESAHFYLFD